jgi:ATP-dependent Lon protease
MEIIWLSGYTDKEKIAIAKGYLIPRQIRENGLRPEEINFSEECPGDDHPRLYARGGRPQS